MAYSTNLFVIAAICGNFWQESTVNPGIWENLTVGAPGYGLGQWTDNAQVSRRTALFNYLSANGYAQDSGYGQLKFFIDENVWNPLGAGGHVSSYLNLSAYLASTSNSLRDLTLEFMYHWEGISDGTEATRFQYAGIFYDAFIVDTGNRVPWHASNSYLSPTEAEENALHIMDFFLGGSPPDPPTPPGPIPPHTRRKGLPPWLIYDLTRKVR